MSHYLAGILIGFAIVVVPFYLLVIASRLGRWLAPKERIARLADEPAELTIERRTQVGGLTVTLGDMLEHFERETGETDENGLPKLVPRVRVVRVICLSGFPIIRSPAEAKALAAALEEFSKEQEDIAWHKRRA